VLRSLARKVGLSLRLDAEPEQVLLAQNEDFKPDLVLNQDLFHVDTCPARQIKVWPTDSDRSSHPSTQRYRGPG